MKRWRAFLVAQRLRIHLQMQEDKGSILGWEDRICHGAAKPVLPNYRGCALELQLLLSRFSRVRLCATPETAAHQAPLPWDSPGKNTWVGCHFLLQCMKVRSKSEVAQSCLTLSDSMDCSPPGSSTHGIFQARVLEWGAIAFSRAGEPQLLKPERSRTSAPHKRSHHNEKPKHWNSTVVPTHHKEKRPQQWRPRRAKDK